MVYRGLCTSAAEAGGFIGFTAGLRPCKPKSGLPGAPKDLLHPAVGRIKNIKRNKALSSDCLNRIYSIQRQFKGEAFKVLLHVIGAGGAGKRQDADLAREGEDNLGRRRVDLRGEPCSPRMTQDLNICRQQREALVDDLSLAAESADFAVPAANGVASILDKRRWFSMGPGHLLQLSERNVADAEKARVSGVTFFDHGLPGFKIGGGPVGAGSGAVENKTVHVVRAQMLKRTGQGLRDLNGKLGRGIVGQTMVLTFLVGELGLKKKIGTRDEARGIGGRQTLSHPGFKVMLALVGCIDGAEAGADGEFSEGRRAVFFPGGAVEEAGNGRGLGTWHHLYSHMRDAFKEGKRMVYAIAQLKITDRGVYDRYQAKFMGVMKRFQGRLLVADERPQVIEGKWDRDKVVLLSFPDEAAFREWAESPEYQEISKDRKAGSEAVVLLVKGIG